MKELLDLFKKNVVPALIFFILGFGSGLAVFKYLSFFFNADVVLKDSYIYKTDIDKNYITIGKYKEIEQDLQKVKEENSQPQKLNHKTPV